MPAVGTRRTRAHEPTQAQRERHALERRLEATLAELAECKERHAFLATNPLTGFLLARAMVDDDGRPVDFYVLDANATFEDLTGLPVSDLLGRRATKALPQHGEDPAMWLAHFAPVATGGDSAQLERRARDGRRWYSAVAYCPQRGYFVVLVHDITRLKEAETRLDAQRRHLEQAQRVDAIGRLAGGVAHDLNNILTAVLGYAGMLEQFLPKESQERQFAHEIRRAAERASALSSQLLAVSRRQVLRPQPLDLYEVLKEVRGLLDPLLPRNVSLTLRCETDAPWVHADRGHLEQVILNLALNARDALPDGGHIEIVVRTATTSPPVPPGPGAHTRQPPATGQWVVLTVSDNGTGMSEETLAHIFEPFYTTKPDGRGTGLGLATVSGIVEQSGGWIEVVSAEGQGSAFHVYLPKVDTPPKGYGEAGTTSPSPLSIGHGRRVLVVDPQDIARALAVAVLEHAGFVAQQADSGREALERIAAASASDDAVAAVVCDASLPDMSPADLLARLPANLPVVLTAAAAHGDTLDALARGGRCAILAKPFSARALLAALRGALHDARARVR